MLQIAREASAVCEIGCGHGHFLRALLGAGWRGKFVGYDISAQGCLTIGEICTEAGIDFDAIPGDFLTTIVPTNRCDIAICRDVVIHQAHWMPMALAMLRIADVAVLGIGYVAETEFHSSALRAQGHYDVAISPVLLQREAKAAGLVVEVEQSYNETHARKELLVTLKHARSRRGRV